MDSYNDARKGDRKRETTLVFVVTATITTQKAPRTLPTYLKPMYIASLLAVSQKLTADDNVDDVVE